MSKPDDCLKVLVVALTYRRAKNLAELLPQLTDQLKFIEDDASILIVDNDPLAGAEAQVGEFSRGDARVGYVHASVPGIAAARNVGLDCALGFDIVVFIDDDERPMSQWLALLIATYREHKSAAVVGPVVSRFPADPDPWIAAGGFFVRDRVPTGTRVPLAATNNLLLDMGQIRDFGLRFDERFGLTGGSDSLFTRQLHALGGVMVWCDEALVYDMVPLERLTRAWVIKRAFRSGNTWLRTSLEIARTPGRRFALRTELATRGFVRVIAGSGRAAFGALTGRLDHRARGVRTAARGAGLVAGALGWVYSEYRRS